MHKVHEARSHEGEKMMTRKQKADGKNAEKEQVTKKAKSENENGQNAVAAEFDEFCKVMKEQLSIQQIRDVLQINGLESSGTDVNIVPKCGKNKGTTLPVKMLLLSRAVYRATVHACNDENNLEVNRAGQDVMFYGVLDKCPMCTNEIEWTGKVYSCKGENSEWSKCTYSTKDPPRKPDQIKLPESLQKSYVSDLIKKHQQDTKQRPKRELGPTDKPFAGMMVSLSGRLSQTHQYWKNKIEKHGGKVSNSVIGVTCLVTASTERERGGSSKLTEAMERQIPVVSEQWIIDSIEKQEAQPLDAYDIASDLIVEGKGIPWDKQDPSNEALESFMAEVKIYGKRGVHKDSKLQDLGGYILEKNGLLYNCGFFICDLGRSLNEFCVTQLIMVPDTGLHLYYKKGRPGADPRAEEKLEQWENVDEAIKEFAKLFEEITGNDFEPWERKKKFQKKPNKFYVIDMDDGVDVRQGGLGLRQLGAAAFHCKLDPHVAYLMKILCSQEIYRCALMEMAHDLPDLPVGMLSNIHLKRCEEMLLMFIEKVKTLKETGQKATAVWKDFSMKWFTLLPSTRPLAFRDHQGLADHGAAALETVRDITMASHLIGEMGDSTLEDPLSERYNKLGCSISALDKKSDDYKMIVKYMEKTYEPLKIGEISYGASVENIYTVEPDACPSYKETKKLTNKQLLWCGTRSSNLLRHLHKGFLPAICWLPVPGYMFGRAIVCSDAAAEAARYGFTALDRPDGFLVLAVASLGEEVKEYNKTPEPEEVKSLEEKKVGVKGLGKKKTDESEHFVWKDDIKVPCGRLVPSEHKDSPLEYNEYAAYDPKLVRIMFLVAVKYEEQDVVYEDVDPDEAGEMKIGDQ